MKNRRGIIVSAVAGYYFVEHQRQTYLCRGRGKLRRGDRPLVGDGVDFSIAGDDEVGTVEQILPRSNHIQRPAVANVDIMAVVIAPQQPQPDLLMVDKLLVLAASLNLEAIICINKADLDQQLAGEYADIYKKVPVKTAICSAKTGQGMEEFISMLNQGTIVLAGQSGVGKSRLTADITKPFPRLPVEVGEISAKIGRGKHTTRHVSLLSVVGSQARIADTPGFNIVNLDLESRSLPRYYPEFARVSPDCQFSTCLHIREPKCAVKTELQRGTISPVRYENYVKIHQQLKEKEDNRY